MNKKGRIGRIIKTVLSSFLIIILAVALIATNTVLPKVSKLANNVLGYNKEIDNSNINSEGLDLEYNKRDFTDEELKEAEARIAYEIASEGTVLLKNENNFLPLKDTKKFSFVGANTIPVSSLLESFFGGSSNTLKDSFETANFQVNEELWNFYESGKGKDYGLAGGSISFGDAEDFRINEAPLQLLEENNLLETLKDTVPVFILSRVAGEGRDMPRSMYQHTDLEEDKIKHYLELDSNEIEILDYLNNNHEEFMVVINANAAIELDWLDNYENLKSVIFAPNTDTLPDIVSGKVNPSGRLVDTFASDALSSPAAQNTGSYRYYDEAGNQTKYNYISYLEGIYVGYKYYETRYEDRVLNQGNAGDYDYQKEVIFPFGHGLSYTSFEWSNYNVVWSDDVATITVDVKNIGDTSGKEVVQIYTQSPYTQYDIDNKVEKASVNLAGFAKTKELAPEEVETVSIEVTEEQLKAYDYTNAKTYILSPGAHYITAAKDAHEAVNNILTQKGKTIADGMSEDGNASLVSTYIPDLESVDMSKYSKDSYSNEDIKNLFDDAHGEYEYLTRNNWSESFPKHDGTPSDEISTWGNEINGELDGKPASYTWMKTASQELIDALDSTDSGSPIDRESIQEEIIYNEKNDLTLIDLRGLDFDDPKWELLLNQLSPSDYQTLLDDSGYGTNHLDSVGKPFNIDADSASGLIYGGTGEMFPKIITLAQTWNENLALEFGNVIGNQALVGGADGWYAPAMNIHRTPFSGRNGEYYSEDGFLSGIFAANSVYGAAEKGMYTFIKHFAINDQENHRGDRKGQYGLTTWTNEQAIREIYLRPFEMAMKVGDVELNYLESDGNGGYTNTSKGYRANQAIMTAFNRIGTTWTGASYPLMTGLLRDEWDFKGFVITDNANTGEFMDVYQMIESGADAKLINAKDVTGYKFDKDNMAEYHYAKKAVHRILYTIANSKAMNNMMPGSIVKDGVQITTKIRIGTAVVSIPLIGLLGFFTIKRHRKKED